MANFDKGLNSGITGFADITGTPKFVCKIYGFKRDLNAQVQTFPGRGDTEWSDIRFVGNDGLLLLRGVVQYTKGYQLPTAFKGATGTIVLQHHQLEDGTVVKETVAVRAISHTAKRDDGEPKGDAVAASTDNWHVTLVCRITAMPTEAGFTGTQPALDAETYSDKSLYDGIIKSFDTGQLQDESGYALLVWGIADSDAAERAEIADAIATVADPLNRGLKCRIVSLTRVNYLAVRVKVQLARTTTDEDVLNEATSKVLDAHHVASTATTAKFNSAPTAPTGDAFVLWSSSTKEYNDAMLLYTADYRLLNPLEAIEFPASHLTLDVSDLTSFGAELKTFTFGQNPPSATDNTSLGVQRVNTTVSRINEVLSQVVYEYAKDTPKQKWEQEHTSTTTDAATFKLESQAEASALDSATPSGPGGSFVKTAQRVQAVTHDHAGYTDLYELLDSNQKVTFPQTYLNLDPSDLSSDGREVQLFTYNTAAPTATDNTGSGVQVVKTTVKRLNRIVSSVQYDYGKDTDKQKWEQEHTYTYLDASGIESKAESSALDGAPAAVVSLVKIGQKTQNLTHDHVGYTDVYDVVSTKTKIEQAESIVVVSAEDQYTRKIASIVTSSAGLSDYADSLFAANQADKTFLDATVSRRGLPADRVLQILKNTGKTHWVELGSDDVIWTQVRGTPTSGMVGNPPVPTGGAVSYGEGTALVIIKFFDGNFYAEPDEIPRSLGSFTIWRLYATDNMPSKQYLALRGSTNNAMFEGYSPGEVAYAGAGATYIKSLSGIPRVLMAYRFRTDNFKWFGHGRLPRGRVIVNTPNIYTGPGYYRSIYFNAGYGPTWMPQKDYSGFTDP